VQITKDGALNALELAGVYPAANVAALATMMALIYPVGIVITLGVSTNPATLLGIGTWTAIEGKVIVGISNEVGDEAFDTLNETGGAQTANLAHTHTVPASSSTSWGPGGASLNNGRLGLGSSENKEASADVATASGGSATQSIVQPYIVKYVWQRTA